MPCQHYDVVNITHSQAATSTSASTNPHSTANLERPKCACLHAHMMVHSNVRHPHSAIRTAYNLGNAVGILHIPVAAGQAAPNGQCMKQVKMDPGTAGWTRLSKTGQQISGAMQQQQPCPTHVLHCAESSLQGCRNPNTPQAPNIGSAQDGCTQGATCTASYTPSHHAGEHYQN
jgi:hypothetical protein